MQAGIRCEPSDVAVTAYNSVDPDFSPPGTSSIVVTFIAFSEPWMRAAASEYVETKTPRGERGPWTSRSTWPPGCATISRSSRWPRPSPTCATPATWAGASSASTRPSPARAWCACPPPGRCEGLYFSGAWVNIGGGYEPSLYSGFLTSRKVLEDMESGWTQARGHRQAPGRSGEADRGHGAAGQPDHPGGAGPWPACTPTASSSRCPRSSRRRPAPGPCA